VSYRKFVILSHLRSGTHLLRTALESHPAIVCQTEVFNSDNPDLPYPLATPTAEILGRFVYHGFPPQIACVGFVLQVYHPWGLEAFPGIRENPLWADVWPRLAALDDLRVIHLRRENGLRRHLSHVMARATGAWHAWDSDRVGAVTHLKVPTAGAGHPVRREAVTLDPERLERDFVETERLHETAARRFASHPRLALRYEDLCRDFDRIAADAQAFLGVPAVPLAPAVAKLDRRPLAQAIANYADLKHHFAATRWASFFDE
jgi:LPS sulfotransferase NodH